VPDIYARINEVAPSAVAAVAQAMEVSAADPQPRAMVDAYVSELDVPEGAQVLEIGCGTGAISRMLASHPRAGRVLGVDPSPLLIARARELSRGVSKLDFQEGAGQELALPDGSFDVVVLHRVLSHVPRPSDVLAQAFRVVRSGGALAAFDGDYATITLATFENDPLQACVAAFAPAYVTDPWIVRRLAGLAHEAGFSECRLRSFGYVQIERADYMVSIADRGADALVAARRIGQPLADAFKAEARRRVEARSFFGHIAYACLIARKA
jgi:ubiquinone/menaquinone biosynthesis C-methylase UbiE